MNVHQAILHGERTLKESGVEQPRWNSERVLILALQQPRSKIYAELDRELSRTELSRFIEFLQKRAEHYPLAYLEGTQEFFGREFFVNESVLIPRPETEELIHTVLSLPFRKNPLLLDLGSGSGNIAVTLAHEIPGSFVVALELSSGAIGVLQRNVKGAVKVVRGNFTSLCFKPASLDAITANLPYVEMQDFHNLPAETRWEPESALLVESLEESYTKVMRQGLQVLKPGGFLVMEFGFGQAGRLSAISSAIPGLDLVDIRKDQRGIPRILLLRKS